MASRSSRITYDVGLKLEIRNDPQLNILFAFKQLL